VISLPIETARLRIRPFDPAADAVALHELWGDPEAMQFVRPDRTQLSPEDVRERLEQTALLDRSGWGFWAVDEQESGAIVGAAGLFPLEWQGPEIELAYHVVPSRWGRGYATEAAGGLLDAAWRETELDHVVAVAFEANRASTRVMEKLGMTYEGPTRYREFEVVRYSIPRPAALA
jgi:[ribosomal protein S5]-alanine N-acetyltransferase